MLSWFKIGCRILMMSYSLYISDDSLNPDSFGGTENWYYCNPTVIYEMRGRGYDSDSYPYWVRQDGVQMLGDYVVVAANLDVHPYGSLVETSLGVGIVCDTGSSFSGDYIEYIDIGTLWN